MKKISLICAAGALAMGFARPAAAVYPPSTSVAPESKAAFDTSRTDTLAVQRFNSVTEQLEQQERLLSSVVKSLEQDQRRIKNVADKSCSAAPTEKTPAASRK